MTRKELSELIKNFIKITTQAYENKEIKGYQAEIKKLVKNKKYRGYSIDASIGMGSLINLNKNLPWIIFLQKGHKASKGFYPTLAFHPEKKYVIIKLGISDTDEHECLKYNYEKINKINKKFEIKIENIDKNFEEKLEQIVYQIDKIIDESKKSIVYNCEETEDKTKNNKIKSS